MLPEKHDSLFDLRKKLDELGEVPGEPKPDQAALWEKLHQRLENKPKRKYAFVYWAAACLLLAVGAIYMQQHKNDNKSYAITKQQSTQTNQQHSAQQTTTAPIIVNPETNIKADKENIAAKKLQQIPLTNPQKPYHQKDTVITAAITDNGQKEANAQPLVQPDTVLHTLVEAPIKKLKVVHINTLGKSKSADIVAPDTRAITARAIKPDDLNHVPSLSFSRNNSDEIIKVKLTPTN